MAATPDSAGFSIPQDYLPFQVNDRRPDFSLVADSNGVPDWDGDLVFDSHGAWKLWRSGGQYLISLESSNRKGLPYQIAYLDEGFSQGRAFTWEGMGELLPNYFPFSYPLDEVLAVNRLALGHGIEVHACGISDHGRGLLFLGVSGAGKSTMSRLWDAGEEVVVLSDDRIIITPRDGRFWIHGTPWHGDAGLADPGGVPLAAIFFLSHGETNTVSSLSPAQTASRLMARSFPTFWNQEGLGFSTGIATDVALTVPGRELEFVPGPETVDYVRRLLDS